LDILRRLLKADISQFVDRIDGARERARGTYGDI